jgi:hypothetical protein
MRRTLALWALALPLAVAAQQPRLQVPSLGDALDLLHRNDRGLHPGADRDLEQTYVIPERPGQNLVAWYDFHWRTYDVPAPGGGKGGIRLYFYDRERVQAARALPAIRSAYARLVDEFHYNPPKKIPFILYGTQREFQTTNVFAVSESVLGVTSPEDLKMSLPYFGDHSRFVEVLTHEMVHQFTIQKLLAETGDGAASPINLLPLWFIEGIAEYYSKGGIDVETDLFLRDLVWNPRPREGYEVVSFGEDRLRGYIPTYKLGQARIAFIAETYGREKIQAFLENAYLMGDAGGGLGGPESPRGFAGLVRRVLDEPIEDVDERWRAWLKHRYYADYLRARQDLAQVGEVRQLPYEPESFVVSPDGSLVLVRGIDRERGRANVFVFEAGHPKRAHVIAKDNVPGVEWLHPLEYGILAIGDGAIAFSAQDGPGDTLYLVRWRRATRKDGKPGPIELSEPQRVPLRTAEGGQFVQIAYPTFSPGGTQIAFVGVGRDGQQDVYVASLAGGVPHRLTNDPYTERDLDWAPDGIYCASDATDHGRMNLFRIDATTGAKTRLTTEPRNDRAPHPQPDGTVLFSSEEPGKPDLYLLEGGQTRRLTDFSTGLNTPAPAERGRGVYASTFHGGKFRLVEVPKVGMLEEPPVAVDASVGAPLPVPEAEIPEDAPAYQPYALKNWKPEAGFVYGGGASGAFAGRAAVLFDDYLRDHVLFVDVAVLGSWEFTEALALYEDRSRRNPLSFGVFHFVQEQTDNLDPYLTYNQRDAGVVGAIRFPLDRFRRLDADLTLGFTQRYCLTDWSNPEVLACKGIQSNAAGDPYPSTGAWNTANGGTNFTISTSGRYGYDSIRYDIGTGPLSGTSFMGELGGIWVPARSAISGFARIDAERYFQLVGRSNIMFRLALGSSFSPSGESRNWERSWWLVGADNLRGFYPGDIAYLRGRNYYVANVELQVPLNPIIRLFIFDYVEGVAAVDFGGVFNKYESGQAYRTSGNLADLGAWDARTLTGVLGVNVVFGPLLLRIHFGHPWDIGGLVTPALAMHASWVTNISLRYLFW